jgi:hypothetical protein
LENEQENITGKEEIETVASIPLQESEERSSSSANKRSKIEREQQLPDIAEMYLRKARQSDIAKKYGLSRQQIAYDLKVIQKRWSDQAVHSLSEAKLKELHNIDLIEREAWGEWERSKQDRQLRSAKKIRKAGETEERIETGIDTEGRLGDPRYLQVMNDCGERRVRLLGLDAPIKVDARVTSVEVRIIHSEMNVNIN